MMLGMCRSVFLLVVTVVGVLSRTTSPATTSTTTTSIAPDPLSPAQKINYTLEMINNGPVVLDGQITFIARLLDKRGKVAQSKEFLYEWNNNADKKFKSVKGDLEYTYVRTFSSASTKQGQWVMNLAVYAGQDYGQMINFGSMKFVLTETLNGFLELRQDLEYQRYGNVFAAGKKIELFANHTDVFEESVILGKVPNFQFFWYKDNDFMHSTKEPHYDLTIDNEGNFTIQTELYAFFDNFHLNHNNTSESLKLGSCDGNNMQSFDFPTIKRRRRTAIADKCGKFSHQLTVKKVLSYVDVSGDRSAAIGQYVKLTVTCKGSHPTSLCWNITAMNSSMPTLNATCPPDEFTDTCTHNVKIKLTETGWKTVWFTVYNDVSYLSYPVNVYAYDPDSVNVPAVTIPLVFGVLGLIVIIIGVTYLNRLRKKPVIEVADFDFHPSVSTGNGIYIVSKLVNKIKVAWLRNTYSRNHTRPTHEETTAKQYESTSLYDSL